MGDADIQFVRHVLGKRFASFFQVAEREYVAG
jgi:hypothetical protein